MISVIFLGKSLDFSEDLLKYNDYKAYFHDLGLSLKKDLKKEYGDLKHPGDGFVGIQARMKKDADEVVKKLFQNGIYDKTADDMGYISIEKMRVEYIEVIQKALALTDEAETQFNLESENAHAAAVSSITGSGMELYSSSPLHLLAFSLWDESLANKQAKKAQAQYDAVVNRIESDIMGSLDLSMRELARKEWYPTIERNVELYESELFEEYLSTLIDNNIFNATSLENLNPEKSKSLLKHISSAKDQKDVLVRAFKAYPCSEDLYLYLIDYDLFSEDEMECAKIFGVVEQIEAYISDYVTEQANDLFFSEENIILKDHKYIKALSLLKDTSYEDVVDSVFCERRSQIVDEIASVRNLTKEELYQLIKNEIISNDQDVYSLYKMGESEYQGLSQEYINQLLHGETSERYNEEINRSVQFLTNALTNYSKDAIENEYVMALDALNDANAPQEFIQLQQRFEKLDDYKNSAVKADECIEKAEKAKIIEQQQIELRQREETLKEKKKKQNITRGLICIGLVVVLLVALFLHEDLSNRRTYNEAFNLASQNKFSEAIEKLEGISDYRDAGDLIHYYESCEDAYKLLETPVKDEYAIDYFADACDSLSVLINQYPQYSEAKNLLTLGKDKTKESAHFQVEKLLDEGKLTTAETIVDSFYLEEEDKTELLDEVLEQQAVSFFHDGDVESSINAIEKMSIETTETKKIKAAYEKFMERFGAFTGRWVLYREKNSTSDHEWLYIYRIYPKPASNKYDLTLGIKSIHTLSDDEEFEVVSFDESKLIYEKAKGKTVTLKKNNDGTLELIDEENKVYDRQYLVKSEKEY